MFATSFRLHKSPDANPMDYSIWSILQSKVRTKKYATMDALKKAIVREWAKIPQDHIRAACNSFFDRLKTLVKAKGGYVELKWMDSEILIIFKQFCLWNK